MTSAKSSLLEIITIRTCSKSENYYTILLNRGSLYPGSAPILKYSVEHGTGVQKLLVCPYCSGIRIFYTVSDFECNCKVLIALCLAMYST